MVTAAIVDRFEAIAVNISANQLDKGTLAQLVQSALTASGLPPGRLEIEVTETALIIDEHVVLDELCHVQSLGVHIALDAF
ncbi:MAG: EAL domain-containing protein, partial [Chromatiales bacterium]|nr:EAL domain-containing protein [Chromatiales bacterium]